MAIRDRYMSFTKSMLTKSPPELCLSDQGLPSTCVQRKHLATASHIRPCYNFNSFIVILRQFSPNIWMAGLSRLFVRVLARGYGITGVAKT